MRFIRVTMYVALVAVIASCATSEETIPQERSYSSTEEITELIIDLPAADQAENRWIFSELVALGPSGLHSLANMLVAPGNGDDTQARYAINGISKYVSASGAESGRTMVENTLIEELKRGHQAWVKVFLMEQLELVGSDKSVPVLQSFIGDNQLNEAAVHALRVINSTRAHQALVEAVSDTEEGNRTVVIKALGDMEVTGIARELLPYASSDDFKTRKVTLYALAQSGDPEAEESLVSAMDTSGEYQQIEAERYYLLFANRLAEEGNTEESSAISRDILAGDYSSEVQSSALTLLAENEGEEALDDLIQAAENSDSWLRSKALTLFEENSDWPIPERWTEGLDEFSAAVQADIIAMIGRSDRSTVSTLSTFLGNDELPVRIAAAQAIAISGEEREALDVLFEAMAEAQEPQEITALKNALLQLPTQPLVAQTAEVLSSASESVRVSLIEILAERRADQHLNTVLHQLESSDDPVRMAVLQSLKNIAEPDDLPRLIDLMKEVKNKKERNVVQEAVVSISGEIPESGKRAGAVLDALQEFPDSQKPYLLNTLPQIGGEEALDAVVKEIESANDSIQQAAISALSDWPEASALSPLRDVFENTPESMRRKVLEGYLRLVEQSKYSVEDKVEMLNDILAETSATEEKNTVISGFAELESPEALKAVAVHFDDENENVKERSLWAAAQILSASDEDTGKELSLIEATTSRENRDKIEQYIGQIESGRGEENNFTTLFNGEDLTGWTGDKDAYTVNNGQIISNDGAAGNLFTEEEYSNFILLFEFKLTPGANNGLAIRSPQEGNPAYEAMELQILDNTAEKYAELEPYQFHGSVYGIAPAERGYLNPVGEWNTQEVIADGSQITVKVNGETITEVDLADIDTSATMDEQAHPGLLRETGHIGFLGHGDEVAFRDIRIQDLDVYYPDYSSGSDNGEGMNQPPEGYSALFNGENLEGWKGLVGNPESRAEMSEEELAEKQEEADTEMREHWSVRDGVLFFDGEGHSLVTEKKYKDFEMMVDWKIKPGGDSGIYLRGSPQVQIWDITEWPQGSGGLYNNEEHPSEPLAAADNSIGEWNNMRVKMRGENVTVHLNDELVVDDVVLENFWDRDKPIYPEGQIELQAHNTELNFKNVFIREIPRPTLLFNGEDLTGWQPAGDDTGEWHADDGLLYTEGGGGWLSTTETYDDFKLELEYRLPEGGNSGIFLRAPGEGNPAYEGLEIQLLDDNSEQYTELDPWQYTGSIYDVKAPSKRVNTEAGQWQKMEVVAEGPDLKVKLNDEAIMNTSLVNFMDRVDEHPGLKRRSGYIGLQNHNSRVEFRDITITEIK